MASIIIPIADLEAKTVNVSYEKNLSRAKLDLAVKRVFLATIILINLGALAAAGTYFAIYCPFPASPVITSSFIIGILGGLITMQVRTFGITTMNLNTQFLNPVSLIGRVLSFVLFGPTIFLYHSLDLTNYADPIKANEISSDLHNLPFEKIGKAYGSNFNNLIRYGFIQEDMKTDLDKMHSEFTPLKLRKDHLMNSIEKIKKNAESGQGDQTYIAKPLADQLAGVQAKLNRLDEQWSRLKEEMSLPEPSFILPNYESRPIQMYHTTKAKIRELFFD